MPADVAQWFEQRSYSHEQFADLLLLGERKRVSRKRVTMILPARNVSETIGNIIGTVHRVNEWTRLVDQLLVVDADSEDDTASVAARHGAEVYSENELMPEYGESHGKGDAMWRALSVAQGDLILFADADTRNFAPQFVYGMLGPIFTDKNLRFVKAAYRRPFTSGEEVKIDGGGRVTELTAKPLFNLFYPELAGFVQPLAGEFVADCEVFRSIPFMTGYAVETAMMIDVLDEVGLTAMGQVDLGERQNRHQPLFELGKMSYAVLRAVSRRMRQEGRLQQGQDPGTPSSFFQFSDYLHAVATPEGLGLREHVEELVERPPVAEVTRASRRSP
jgi:glucosyl-3-phosphoglycerate synthase